MAGNPAVVNHMRAIGRICEDTYGLRVVELAGWTTRGRSSTFVPSYTIEHHTAAPVDITAMLINGRPDLNGPLCNFELRKDGTVGLLASGRANHAGIASISSTESYGIEATGPVPKGNTGADAYPQYGAYIRLVAAICLHHGWGTDRVKAHKEICQPPGRKPDPMFDMDAFRRAVKAAMEGKEPEQEQEWWEMPIPTTELQKIQTQAEQALMSADGQAALRKAFEAEVSEIVAAVGANQFFVKQIGHPQVYVVSQGELFHVPDQKTLIAMGGSNARDKILEYAPDADIWEKVIHGQPPGPVT
jgi:N-acetylmuramoyl-L-alanine amidase